MKRVITILGFIFHISVCYSQTCEQRLKTVIDGYNSFNNCSQRAEMNRLLRIQTTIVQECPVLYAQNQDKINAAMRRVEQAYKSLGCTNNGASATSSTSNNGINAQTNGVNLPNDVSSTLNYVKNQMELLRNKPESVSNSGTEDMVNRGQK